MCVKQVCLVPFSTHACLLTQYVKIYWRILYRCIANHSLSFTSFYCNILLFCPRYLVLDIPSALARQQRMIYPLRNLTIKAEFPLSRFHATAHAAWRRQQGCIKGKRNGQFKCWLHVAPKRCNPSNLFQGNVQISFTDPISNSTICNVTNHNARKRTGRGHFLNAEH